MPRSTQRMRRHVARRRLRTGLPAALLALAFVAGLAAAAPHSVHHLGEEREGQPPDCPAALAWGAAAGADCPVVTGVSGPPVETDRVSAELPFHSPTASFSARPGRAPPALF